MFDLEFNRSELGRDVLLSEGDVGWCLQPGSRAPGGLSLQLLELPHLWGQNDAGGLLWCTCFVLMKAWVLKHNFPVPEHRGCL